MISKVYGNSITGNNYQGVKNAQKSPYFQGYAHFNCDDLNKCPDFLRKCSRFLMNLTYEVGDTVTAKGASDLKKANYTITCDKSVDARVEEKAQIFAKNNSIDFKFERSV